MLIYFEWTCAWLYVCWYVCLAVGVRKNDIAFWCGDNSTFKRVNKKVSLFPLRLFFVIDVKYIRSTAGQKCHTPTRPDKDPAITFDICYSDSVKLLQFQWNPKKVKILSKRMHAQKCIKLQVIVMLISDLDDCSAQFMHRKSWVSTQASF